MSNKKKRAKKITLYVSAYGKVSFDQDFEDYVEVCQKALDKIGITEERRNLANNVVTKIVVSVESMEHGKCETWVQWESLKGD